MENIDPTYAQFRVQLSELVLAKENAALRAENEALKKENVLAKKGFNDAMSSNLDLYLGLGVSEKQVKRLKEELKALKKAVGVETRAQRVKYRDAVKAERQKCRDLVAKRQALRIRTRKEPSPPAEQLYMDFIF